VELPVEATDRKHYKNAPVDGGEIGNVGKHVDLLKPSTAFQPDQTAFQMGS